MTSVMTEPIRACYVQMTVCAVRRPPRSPSWRLSCHRRRRRRRRRRSAALSTCRSQRAPTTLAPAAAAPAAAAPAAVAATRRPTAGRPDTAGECFYYHCSGQPDASFTSDKGFWVRVTVRAHARLL